MKRKLFFLSALCLVIGAVLLAACAVPPPSCPPLEPGEVELAFETVGQGYIGWVDENVNEPRVFLLDNSQDLSLVKPYLYPNDYEELESINLGTYFVVVLMRERNISTGYDVVIRRVAQRQDGVVTICAELWSPNTSGDLTAETSPLATYYTHIVSVERGSIELQFSESILHTLSLTPTPIPY